MRCLHLSSRSSMKAYESWIWNPERTMRWCKSEEAPWNQDLSVASHCFQDSNHASSNADPVQKQRDFKVGVRSHLQQIWRRFPLAGAKAGTFRTASHTIVNTFPNVATAESWWISPMNQLSRVLDMARAWRFNVQTMCGYIWSCHCDGRFQCQTESRIVRFKTQVSTNLPSVCFCWGILPPVHRLKTEVVTLVFAADQGPAAPAPPAHVGVGCLSPRGQFLGQGPGGRLGTAVWGRNTKGSHSTEPGPTLPSSR